VNAPLTGVEQLARFETLPDRMLDKVLWAKAQQITVDQRGPRPEPQASRLATAEFPSFATVARASAELELFSAALDWDRAKRDTHRRLALAEGFEVTDAGLVPAARRA